VVFSQIETRNKTQDLREPDAHMIEPDCSFVSFNPSDTILPMATIDTTVRPDYVRALPNLSQAAELIEISPAGITRGMEALGIEPLMWGLKEKHLDVGDLLRLAAHLRRASIEEVAGGLLELVGERAPDQLSAVSDQVDRYFDALPPRRPVDGAQFLAELREELPKRHAEQAEAIYRRHAESTQ
jgi:hypothetical protein